MLPVAILSGGLATRLRPATLKLPKALVEVAGRPFIHHQLALLREKGVREVLLCVGFLGEMIEDSVGDGSRFGLSVRYSHDGDNPLGTGGAIKKASEMLPDQFMILYGDSYLDIDLRPVVRRFLSGGLPILMTVYRNRNRYAPSNLLVEDGRILKYDKKAPDPAMEYIDYGLIVLRKEVLDPCPAGKPFDLSLLLARRIDAGDVLPFEVRKRFYEAGSVQGIRETEEYIRKRRPSEG